MLEAHGVSYRYGKSSFLFKQINITISPGEVVGLYGESGTGKTTFAKIISGYMKPNEGRITIDGSLYPKTGIQPVQLVWQHPEKAINPTWKMKKVLQEVGYDEDNQLLSELGIQKEWLQRRSKELSSGELQRFCLARSLGPETKYIIADEITTMLDAVTQAQVWTKLLRMTADCKLGVLAISHNLHLLQRVSHRVINFNDLVNNKE